MIDMPQDRKAFEFSPGGKPRPFNGDKSPAFVGGGAGLFAGCLHVIRQLWAKWIGDADVCHQTVAKERTLPKAGEIEELVGDDHLTRGVIVAQGPTGADADHPLDPQGLERINIGAVVDLGWGNMMADPVAGQESHGLAFQAADHNRGARLAERRLDFNTLPVFQPGHILQAGSTDDRQGRVVFHKCSVLRLL